MVFLGTSGWTYASWNRSFYPTGLSAGQRLEFYAQEFDTVELNASYYRWPSDAQFASWAHRLPAGFEFSVKAPKGLTHESRLKNTEQWCERITVSLNLLGDRRGVLLLQFPPNLRRDVEGLAAVLAQFPKDFRVAVEFRNTSWQEPEVTSLLREYNAALVQTDPQLSAELTADFLFLRLHGPNPRRPYHGSYSTETLELIARGFAREHRSGLTGYCYFNNDADGYAIRNARDLRALYTEIVDSEQQDSSEATTIHVNPPEIRAEGAE